MASIPRFIHASIIFILFSQNLLFSNSKVYKTDTTSLNLLSIFKITNSPKNYEVLNKFEAKPALLTRNKRAWGLSIPAPPDYDYFEETTTARTTTAATPEYDYFAETTTARTTTTAPTTTTAQTTTTAPTTTTAQTTTTARTTTTAQTTTTARTEPTTSTTTETSSTTPKMFEKMRMSTESPETTTVLSDGPLVLTCNTEYCSCSSDNTSYRINCNASSTDRVSHF